MECRGNFVNQIKRKTQVRSRQRGNCVFFQADILGWQLILPKNQTIVSCLVQCQNPHTFRTNSILARPQAISQTHRGYARSHPINWGLCPSHLFTRDQQSDGWTHAVYTWKNTTWRRYHKQYQDISIYHTVLTYQRAESGVSELSEVEI